MLSSGIRLRACDELKWKHIITLYDEKNKVLVATKILVYAGDEEEYYSFITPEAYFSLQEWMDFRALHGKKITGESWLMRDMWQITDLPTHGGPIRLAYHPKKLTVGAIKNIVYRALRSQQIIKKLNKENGDGNRHEFKMIHGYRKAFKIICENAGMKSINIELLLGHNIGVSSSYYKPKQQEVLEDYVKNVVNDLTIDESHRLQKQVQELKGENEYKEYLNQQSLNRIKLENQELREELEKIRKAADFSEIKEQLNEIRQQMRIEKKREMEKEIEKK